MPGNEKIGRRHFGKLITGAAVGASLPGLAVGAPQQHPHQHPHKRLRKPARLREGDTIGLITPSSRLYKDAIDKAVANIESLGLRVKLGANLRAAHGSFAGSVEQRLEDLHNMFADPTVRGIWAVRGGTGAMSLLPSIRYDLVRKYPKVLVGYSDITALHLALYRHAGLVSFHGPVATSTFSDYSVSHLRAVLMEPQRQTVIHMDPEGAAKAAAEPAYLVRTLREGVAEGRLIGGNLSLVSAMIGTPYAADFSQCIAFLEDVDEPPYRIDRMLTQLEMTADFRRAAGLMYGVFDHCVPKDEEDSFTVAQTFDEHMAAHRHRPVVSGFSFGHISRQFTLPVGVRARLDTAAQTLTLLEAAVT